MNFNIIILLIFSHFWADFMLQSDYMAKNKSDSDLVLLIHSFVYGTVITLIMCVFCPPLLISNLFVIFWFICIMSHIVIDGISSVATKLIWIKNGACRDFFNLIGFDQFLHYCVLFSAWHYLIKIDL